MVSLHFSFLLKGVLAQVVIATSYRVGVWKQDGCPTFDTLNLVLSNRSGSEGGSDRSDSLVIGFPSLKTDY
jgi:hypothetical protein